jgi:hypothetical protein
VLRFMGFAVELSQDYEIERNEEVSEVNYATNTECCIFQSFTKH